MPTTKPSPQVVYRTRAIPEGAYMREPDGHTMWFKGGGRVHDPAWCGACLLAAKISVWANGPEEETDERTNDEA